MRVAFLCKRRYMGKDVIADRYARLYELPYQLARCGHDVLGLCLDYWRQSDGRWRHEAAPGALTWESRSRHVLPAYPALALRRLREFGPDLIVGASDIPHVALARWLARRLRVPYVADLYDNFEGFGQARIPGMKTLLRGAVREAQVVTTTSESLAEYVRDDYRATGTVVAMPSTIDAAVFRRRDKAEARRLLGLPARGVLIGTAGGLHRDKGVGVLYDAWPALAASLPDAQLVLAGPHPRGFPPPADPRIRYLGQLPHEQVGTLFAALDVGVIYLRDTVFGRFCFPQKAYEMLACGLPVAAADIGEMARLFRTVPQALYRADDATDLARCVRAQIDRPVTVDVPILDWRELVALLEPQLRAVASSSAP